MRIQLKIHLNRLHMPETEGHDSRQIFEIRTIERNSISNRFCGYWNFMDQ